MVPPYVIGVDGGTESIRAGVFDTDGNALALASCSYATNYPQPGWAEQVRPPQVVTWLYSYRRCSAGAWHL